MIRRGEKSPGLGRDFEGSRRAVVSLHCLSRDYRSRSRFVLKYSEPSQVKKEESQYSFSGEKRHMSGRTASGLVLIVVGVAVAFWGINLMNSFGAQLGRQLGMQDNTGPIAIGAGVVLGLIGLVLAASKGSTSSQPTYPSPVLPETRSGGFCMNCGAALPLGAQFCTGCGMKKASA